MINTDNQSRQTYFLVLSSFFVSLINSLYILYFKTSFRKSQAFFKINFKNIFCNAREVDITMILAFDKIKELADKQGISLNTLEERLGYSTNYLYSLKKGNPKSDRLQEIADYFNVSTDYLLGRTNNPKIASEEEINEIDLKEAAKESFFYDGHELNDEDIELISSILETRMKNRKKD